MGGESFEPLVYSASIGMSNRAKLVATLLVYRAFGLKHFKVKVGGSEDIERIRLIRRVLGRGATLFADANASWGRETAIRHMEALQAQGVWAVEEPLRSAEPGPTSVGGLDRFAVLTDTHYEDYRWLRERYIPVAGKNYTGSTIYYVRKFSKVFAAIPRLVELRKHRKDPQALLRLIECEGADLPEIEEAMSRELAASVRICISKHARMGIDVDKPSDLELAIQLLKEDGVSGRTSTSRC